MHLIIKLSWKRRKILERSVALLGWKMVGEVLIPNVNDEGEITKTNGISLAQALAEKI